MNKISGRSIGNLEGLDSRLILLVGMVLARGKVDFTLTSGIRTLEEQQAHYAKGRTVPGIKVTNTDGIVKKSKHQLGLAFDFIPYPFKGWDDDESFRAVGAELKICAKHLGFSHSYGGDWSSFVDLPHFQLNK